MGKINTSNEPVFRMYQCRVCKKSFKRSHGVLFISGFFCDACNPCNKIHLKNIDYRNVPDTLPGNIGEKDDW